MLQQIFFYSQNQEYGEFSNYAPFGIEIDGLWYPTVEHYYQSQKFEDIDYAELIRNAETPKKASELGKSKNALIKPNWDDIRLETMKKAVTVKFKTHPKLQEVLLATDNAELVENSPYDYFWGCGKDGSGQNNLGKILMEIRETLKNTKNNE